MNELIMKALSSDHAQELCYRGWTLDEIERRVCVDCGHIDMAAFGLGEVAIRGGRKQGTRPNGTHFDAGHICGACITAPTQKEPKTDE